MAAYCWICTAKATTLVIDDAHGGKNDPLGACSNCHAFACGHHGVRTSSAQFVCLECVPSLAAASTDTSDFEDRGEDPEAIELVVRAGGSYRPRFERPWESIRFSGRDDIARAGLERSISEVEALWPEGFLTWSHELLAFAGELTLRLYGGDLDPHQLLRAARLMGLMRSDEL